jgi:hypothetical protein
MPVTPLLLPPSSLHNKILLWWSSIQWCSSKVYLAKFGDIQNIWIVENHEYLFKFSNSRQLWRFFVFSIFFRFLANWFSKHREFVTEYSLLFKNKFTKWRKFVTKQKSLLLPSSSSSSF